MKYSTLLLRVAAKVRDDRALCHRILRAAMRVAADEYNPDVQPGVALDKSPMEVVTEHEDAIVTLFDGKNMKDDVITSAMGISTSLAALTRQIDQLLEAIPLSEGTEEMEPEEQATQEGLDAFRNMLTDLRSEVEALVPFGQKMNDVAKANPETIAPKFPSLPKSVLPNPEDEVEEVPVVAPKEEEETEEEDAESEEDSEPSSLDDMQALLQE